MQLFGKFSRRQQEKLDDLEAQVEHTICLCALAGFSTDKIFSCISAMPEFSRVNKPRYRPKKLLETFSEICNNQSPAILSLLEEDGITAADLQKEADHLYGKHVNHGKPIRDISVKYEELGRFVERWGQAIRMLQDHKSYRLAARFEDEIRRAAINAQVPYFSSGASKKADKNLEIFNAGAEARRAEIVADAPYNNNRPVDTPSTLSNRASSTSADTKVSGPQGETSPS